MPHALIVDDEPEALAWMSQVVQAEGYTVATAETLHGARAQLALQRPDLLLTDLLLPDGQGIELASDLRPPGSTELVVVTGHASVDSAIEAVRIGAGDYLTKPVDMQRLLGILRRSKHWGPLGRDAATPPELARKPGRFGHLLGDSPPMRTLYEKLARVAPTSATVLLTGESGTGKELAARTLHELSRRRRFPFLPINCGALSPHLVESELFGHEKGSFTGAERQHRGYFEQANGGTIFLDEVTETPPDLQVKLLRVLETGTFVPVGAVNPQETDVRIIAAANRSPDAAVRDGKLREDLYHRLNVFPIRMPALRERSSDIELLAREFLDELNRIEGTAKRFSASALARLYTMKWPGNVRQLRNYVQRAYILADEVVETVEFQPSYGGIPDDHSDTLVVRVGTPLAEVERRLTMATLEQCGQVKRTAARMLGISLKTLYNRLEAYALADKVRDESAQEDPLAPGAAPSAHGASAHSANRH